MLRIHFAPAHARQQREHCGGREGTRKVEEILFIVAHQDVIPECVEFARTEVHSFIVHREASVGCRKPVAARKR
jgi:hypothetical protein